MKAYNVNLTSVNYPLLTPCSQFIHHTLLCNLARYNYYSTPSQLMSGTGGSLETEDTY